MLISVLFGGASRRPGMLILLQAAISVVALTGVAGSAINILAGDK